MDSDKKFEGDVEKEILRYFDEGARIVDLSYLFGIEPRELNRKINRLLVARKMDTLKVDSQQ